MDDKNWQIAVTEEDKRRWALEQSVKLHGSRGSSLEVVFSDAERLLAFTKPK